MRMIFTQQRKKQRKNPLNLKWHLHSSQLNYSHIKLYCARLPGSRVNKNYYMWNSANRKILILSRCLLTTPPVNLRPSPSIWMLWKNQSILWRMNKGYIGSNNWQGLTLNCLFLMVGQSLSWKMAPFFKVYIMIVSLVGLAMN